MEENRKSLLTHINNSISQSFDQSGKGDAAGIIGLLGSSCKLSQTDIPAVFESYSLLSHYLSSGIELCLMNSDSLDKLINDCKSRVVITHENNKVILLVNIDEGELPYILHWCSDSIQSETVRNMEGVYVLPFYYEGTKNDAWLIPDWCHAFYLHGDHRRCVPLLAFRSIENAIEFPNGDYAATALHRLSSYALPVDTALEQLEKKTRH